ncbi:MAG: hypothetical protein M1821_006440 [Bathelium mastoideum]|nr:MAG: hypothetical protein M1821_006440 [Bathelium mastoideum]
MASVPEAARAPATATHATPTSPPRLGGRRGGFARDNNAQSGSRGGAPGFRGRGRGRGRGNHEGRGGQQRPAASAINHVPTRNGSLGVELLRDSDHVESAQTTPTSTTATPTEVEAEVCFICASPVEHNSVAPCNHRTCHICALRLRALYKTKACAHCRTNSHSVIFTDNATKRYEDFNDEDFARVDDNLGIRYEKQDIFEDTVLLLRYNCPTPSCDVACLGWPDLHRHVKGVHGKMMCDLCTRNKKVFTHEHELFTASELRRHEKFGDDSPGSVDQSGFKGHPECGFCRMRFYGDDELYAHCREKHERCHICDRQGGNLQQQYYRDYNALEEHFGQDHFLCRDKECLEQKFVVFASEMDLRAHQLEKHPNGMTKDARRDARRVDMSGFDYRAPSEQERGPGRRGRGRGRGRDPNAEPLPTSSAQPLRRDELAYQRQMAIQSAQSISSRTFGGHLTSANEMPSRDPPRQANSQNRSTQDTNSIVPSLENLAIAPSNSASQPTSPRPMPVLTPQEQARQLRHNAVIERASNMLQNDGTKLSSFRARISSFRSSSITAAELIDAFFSLFDTSSVELGKLVKELAEIFEIPDKRNDLLMAWSDWKAINEDYPSLPGPSGIPAGASASTLGSGGSRVLKLKSSTARSNRSPANRQRSWGSAFPPIEANAPGPGSSAADGSKPVWAAANPTAARAQPKPTPQGGTSSKAFGKEEAFPALPAAAKPSSTVFSPGYSGPGVRRDRSGTSTPVNAWANGPGGGGGTGSGEASANASAGASEVEAEEASVSTKRKGNKGKKQMLFQWG